MANDEKRHESAVIKPPDTAVSLVDLCRQRDTDNGDMSRETQVQRGHNQSIKIDKYRYALSIQKLPFLKNMPRKEGICLHLQWLFN